MEEYIDQINSIFIDAFLEGIVIKQEKQRLVVGFGYTLAIVFSRCWVSKRVSQWS